MYGIERSLEFEAIIHAISIQYSAQLCPHKNDEIWKVKSGQVFIAYSNIFLYSNFDKTAISLKEGVHLRTYSDIDISFILNKSALEVINCLVE
jgi:hypothetical protein